MALVYKATEHDGLYDIVCEYCDTRYATESIEGELSDQKPYPQMLCECHIHEQAIVKTVKRAHASLASRARGLFNTTRMALTGRKNVFPPIIHDLHPRLEEYVQEELSRLENMPTLTLVWYHFTGNWRKDKCHWCGLLLVYPQPGPWTRQITEHMQLVDFMNRAEAIQDRARAKARNIAFWGAIAAAATAVALSNTLIFAIPMAALGVWLWHVKDKNERNDPPALEWLMNGGMNGRIQAMIDRDRKRHG